MVYICSYGIVECPGCTCDNDRARGRYVVERVATSIYERAARVEHIRGHEAEDMLNEQRRANAWTAGGIFVERALGLEAEDALLAERQRTAALRDRLQEEVWNRERMKITGEQDSAEREQAAVYERMIRDREFNEKQAARDRELAQIKTEAEER